MLLVSSRKTLGQRREDRHCCSVSVGPLLQGLCCAPGTQLSPTSLSPCHAVYGHGEAGVMETDQAVLRSAQAPYFWHLTGGVEGAEGSSIGGTYLPVDISAVNVWTEQSTAWPEGCGHRAVLPRGTVGTWGGDGAPRVAPWVSRSSATSCSCTGCCLALCPSCSLQGVRSHGSCCCSFPSCLLCAAVAEGEAGVVLTQNSNSFFFFLIL